MDVSALPVPLSRIEKLWNCLITGETPDFEPLSRNEKYLMAMLDRYDFSNLPAPMSRGEKLLYKIAVGETDLSDVPGYLSRYEELLKYLIENGGISGGDFEYILYTLNQSIYTLYPTAEKPVKSAILKGQTLANLIYHTQNMAFSYSSAEAKEVYTINDISPRKLNITVNTQPTYWYYITVKINIDLLKPNTKYLIKAKNLNNIVSAQICEGSGDNKLAVKQPFMDNSYAIITTNDLSTLNGKEILYIVITDFKKNTIEYPTTISVEDIMLIEYQDGMENWDIPYFEGMQSVKMPVLTTTGKNIIKNSSDVYIYENHDDTNKLSTFTQLSLDANYKQMLRGKEVAISVDAIGENLAPLANVSAPGGNHYGADINVIFEDGTSQWLSLTKGGGIPVNGSFNGRYYKTFTVQDKPIKQVSTCQLFCRTTMGKLTLTNVQLEIGNANSNYEPYKSNILTVNEPVELRGIGEVKDELNLMTGELIQNVNEIVLTGNANEKWTKHEGLSTNEASTFVWKVEELKATGNVLCDKLSNKKMWSDKEIGIWFDSNLIITISSSIATTVEQFRTYLNETPFTVYYQSSEKSIKTVDLTVVDQDNQPTQLGTFENITHVSLEAENLIPEVEMEVATHISEELASASSLMEDISTKQEKLNTMVDEQSENVDATMIATTEIFEEIL